MQLNIIFDHFFPSFFGVSFLCFCSQKRTFMLDIILFNCWQLFLQILPRGIFIYSFCLFYFISLILHFMILIGWIADFPLKVAGSHSQHSSWYNSTYGHAYGSWGILLLTNICILHLMTSSTNQNEKKKNYSKGVTELCNFLSSKINSSNKIYFSPIKPSLYLHWVE